MWKGIEAVCDIRGATSLSLLRSGILNWMCPDTDAGYDTRCSMTISYIKETSQL
jgi:hypothetical protein